MKSLNILEPQTVDIVVKLAGTNSIQTFTVPRYTSLWKFRMLIAEKFDLGQSNFEI